MLFRSQTQAWKTGSLGDEGVFVMENQPVPLMRSNALMPVATVDGAVRTATYGELRNMRNWVDIASIPDSVQFDALHTGTP